tara:strand:- start:1333 stop:2613 length:1281 start_codon:yes stop_codon:yes gene_type:complete
MPTHKITNEFIRKYNKEFAIRGYSKMTVAEKTTAIQNAVNKTGGAMKAEWAGIMKNYKPRGGGGTTTVRKTTARKKPTKAKPDDMDGFLSGLASPAKKPTTNPRKLVANKGRPSAPTKKPPTGSRIMKDGPYKGMKLFDRHGGRKDGGRRATEPLPVADRRTKIDLRTKKPAPPAKKNPMTGRKVGTIRGTEPLPVADRRTKIDLRTKKPAPPAKKNPMTGRKVGTIRGTEPLPVADRRTKIDLRTKKPVYTLAQKGPGGVARPAKSRRPGAPIGGPIGRSAPGAKMGVLYKSAPRVGQMKGKQLAMTAMGIMSDLGRERTEARATIASSLAKKIDNLYFRYDTAFMNAGLMGDRKPMLRLDRELKQRMKNALDVEGVIFTQDETRLFNESYERNKIGLEDEGYWWGEASKKYLSLYRTNQGNRII